MNEILGYKRFCEYCKYGLKKWKSVYCNNPYSNFNGKKVNAVRIAHCFELKEDKK